MGLLQGAGLASAPRRSLACWEQRCAITYTRRLLSGEGCCGPTKRNVGPVMVQRQPCEKEGTASTNSFQRLGVRHQQGSSGGKVRPPCLQRHGVTIPSANPLQLQLSNTASTPRQPYHNTGVISTNPSCTFPSCMIMSSATRMYVLGVHTYLYSYIAHVCTSGWLAVATHTSRRLRIVEAFPRPIYSAKQCEAAKLVRFG